LGKHIGECPSREVSIEASRIEFFVTDQGLLKISRVCNAISVVRRCRTRIGLSTAHRLNRLTLCSSVQERRLVIVIHRRMRPQVQFPDRSTLVACSRGRRARVSEMLRHTDLREVQGTRHPLWPSSSPWAIAHCSCFSVLLNQAL